MKTIHHEKNLNWILKLKRLIPKFSFSTPNVDPIKFMIYFGVLMFIAFLLFAVRVSYTMAQAYIIQQKKLDVRVEEQLTPLKAKIEYLESKVSELESHAQIRYYRYETKQYQVYKNGRFSKKITITKIRGG